MNIIEIIFDAIDTVNEQLIDSNNCRFFWPMEQYLCLERNSIIFIEIKNKR